MDDLLTAVRLSTLLWGGLANPMIPVGGDSALADALVRMFNVDVLVPVAEADVLKQYAKRYPYLTHPSHFQREVVYRPTARGAEVVYLDMLDLIGWYWEEHGKAAPTDAKAFAVLPEWSSDDPLASAFTLMFGAFPDDAALRHYPGAFRRGLRASARTLEVAGPVPAELLDVRSPVEATMLELSGDAGHLWGDGIYLGDRANPQDFVNFWNLRASGQDLTYHARGLEDRLRAYTQAQLVGVAQRTRHTGPALSATVYFASARPEEFDALRALLPAEATLINARCDAHLWNGLNVRPALFHFARESTMATVEPTERGYDVTLQLPAKSFLARTSTRDLAAHTRALAVSLHPYGESAYPGHTLLPPHLPQLHEYYSREMHHDPWRLRSESEGVAALVSITDSVIYLRPLAHAGLIRRLFSLAGITAVPSQAGRIAQRIILSMGDVEGCRVFKIAGVRDLLQALKSDETVERGEATKRIFRDGDFKRNADLYIEQRERGTTLTPPMTFDFLLKKDLFRAGLELLCDQCGLKSWRTLKDLDDAWGCEYCGAAGKTSLQLRNRGDWKFRKSGLFAKDNNQEGALPIILTLMTFVRVLDFSAFCYSTALDLQADGLKCETDLCVVQRGQGLREFALAIGECKAGGGTIDDEDVLKMRAARDRLVAAGIPVYVVFAKSAPAFSPEEVERFRTAASAGTPLILLTNRELEPYHPYWDDEGEQLPAKYAHSLEDMARNSNSRYLAPPAAPPAALEGQALSPA